jgi:hypothetical protein
MKRDFKAQMQDLLMDEHGMLPKQVSKISGPEIQSPP